MSARLHIAPCTHEAAALAVTRWHYSGVMPSGKLIRYGVWEDDAYIGCVLFGRGANHRLGSPFGLAQTEACELVRVALRRHVTPVSRILSICTRLIRTHAPGLRLIVSYADPEQGHHGGVYAGAGWTYTGTVKSQELYLLKGRWVHGRTASAARGTVKGLPSRHVAGKHVYVFPLDAAMRAQVAPLAKPYPKRAGSIVADAPPVQGGEGGSVPTPALHLSSSATHARG